MHVGGTNGKGSVSVLAYTALREAGFSVGLYTSPHLVDVRERMIVDGRAISREAFARWTESVRPAIERSEASFFEATTAIALADFAARRVDVAVIEVGLGGAWPQWFVSATPELKSQVPSNMLYVFALP